MRIHTVICVACIDANELWTIILPVHSISLVLILLVSER